MKNRIFNILIVFTLVLAGTAGMAANTVAASDADSEYDIQFELIYEEYVPSPYDNDSDTQEFYGRLRCNGYVVGEIKHTVYWEWDYTYVIDWSVTTTTYNRSNGGYSGVCTFSDNDSANYASWVDCWSWATFDVFYGATQVGEDVPVTIDTGHGADGSYWVI
ncbi:MAG: hypothetical protein PHD14_02535 [Dehalococcoidales bacterium]|jgi:hypothetical protein|nr:hypothetical protein [Dehalococcoidales bacterium]